MKGNTVTVCLAALALLAVSYPAQIQATNYTDIDLLNFALNLEYLEAEFYSYAAYGYGLSAEDRGNGSASIGGQKANLTAFGQAYVEELARNELGHVRFLRAALGSAAVPIPLIDIGKAFSNLAAIALGLIGVTPNPPFSPYANDLFFYHASFLFEDAGVSAYKGAAPLLQGKGYIGAAAGLMAAEAYHAGIARSLLYQSANVTVYGIPVYKIVGAISAVRDLANPEVSVDQGILTKNGTLNLVLVDEDGIAFGRTPQQVLKLIYNGGTKSGGFFPNGLTGPISVVATS